MDVWLNISLHDGLLPHLARSEDKRGIGGAPGRWAAVPLHLPIAPPHRVLVWGRGREGSTLGIETSVCLATHLSVRLL